MVFENVNGCRGRFVRLDLQLPETVCYIPTPEGQGEDVETVSQQMLGPLWKDRAIPLWKHNLQSSWIIYSLSYFPLPSTTEWRIVGIRK